MASEINITPHRYIAIFRGRSCIEVRIDVVSNEYVSKLKKIKLTKNEIEEGISINYKLYEKVLNEMYADELHIFGMGEHGLIQIYEKSSNKFQTLEELGKPIYEDDGIKKLAVKKITPTPTPNSTIVACLCAQDGIMGHINLELAAPFDPKNLTLIFTSGDFYATDSAITGIEYNDEGGKIVADIDSSEYLQTYPKVEIFFCSNYDAKGKEVPLFEDGEWISRN